MHQPLQQDLLKQEHEVLQRDLKRKAASFRDTASVWFLLPFEVFQAARESKCASTEEW